MRTTDRTDFVNALRAVLGLQPLPLTERARPRDLTPPVRLSYELARENIENRPRRPNGLRWLFVLVLAACGGQSERTPPACIVLPYDAAICPGRSSPQHVVAHCLEQPAAACALSSEPGSWCCW